MQTVDNKDSDLPKALANDKKSNCKESSTLGDVSKRINEIATKERSMWVWLWISIAESTLVPQSSADYKINYSNLSNPRARGPKPVVKFQACEVKNPQIHYGQYAKPYNNQSDIFEEVKPQLQVQ